jgi:hypothetical protein
MHIITAFSGKIFHQAPAVTTRKYGIYFTFSNMADKKQKTHMPDHLFGNKRNIWSILL